MFFKKAANYEYFEDDIAVIGIGCVLPGSDTPDDFFKSLKDHKRFIHHINSNDVKEEKDRFTHSSFFFNRDKNVKDKAYSDLAALVTTKTLKKLKPDFNILKDNRLQIITREAIRQAIRSIDKNLLKECSLYLGVMNPDEIYYRQKFFNEKETIKELFNETSVKDVLDSSISDFFKGDIKTENLVPSFLLTDLKKEFSIKGEGLFVDAACASSFTALEVACKKIQTEKCKYAIAGGLEANLSLGTFVLFSKVGAMSDPELISCPFDIESTGLAQGEGVTTFLLTTMKNALEKSHKVLGVIKGIGASSDGRSSSLFQPTPEGQVLAYQRAYSFFGSRKADQEIELDFIECHATGTKLGDKTELESLEIFFPNKKMPIGSVKTQVGHTKGAAGGASLIKAIYALNEKEFPGAGKYFKEYAPELKTNFKVIRENLKLKTHKDRPLRAGVSSFGFGGANYHLVIEEASSQFTLKPRMQINKHEYHPVVSAYEYFSFDEYDDLLNKTKHKIPPNSLPQIDKYQIFGVLGVEQTLIKNRISLNLLDKNEVGVISASITGLDAALFLSQRSMAVGLIESFISKGAKIEMIDKLNKYKDKFPDTTEDTGPGILNNVIAGRICNAFDFRGISFNLDSDLASLAGAIGCGMMELQSSDGVMVLAVIDEEIDSVKYEIVRKGMHILIISNLEYAQKHELPIKYELGEVEYHNEY